MEALKNQTDCKREIFQVLALRLIPTADPDLVFRMGSTLERIEASETRQEVSLAEIKQLLEAKGVAREPEFSDLEKLNRRFAAGWAVFYESGSVTGHQSVRGTDDTIGVTWSPTNVSFSLQAISVRLPFVTDGNSRVRAMGNIIGLRRIAGERMRFPVGRAVVEAEVIKPEVGDSVVLVGVGVPH